MILIAPSDTTSMMQQLLILYKFGGSTYSSLLVRDSMAPRSGYPYQLNSRESAPAHL